jgi:hypothetical protein
VRSDGQDDKTQRENDTSVNSGFTKVETATPIEKERQAMKKPKTRFLRSIRRMSRPTSSPAGERQLSSSPAQIMPSVEDLKTSSRAVKVGESSSSAGSKSCMPTAFDMKLHFNSTYEESRVESKEGEAPSNKACIPIKVPDNSPSVENRMLPVYGAKHALREETSGKDIQNPWPNESFGKLLCRGHNVSDLDSTRKRPDPSNAHGEFPLVRIVSDGLGAQKTIAGKSTSNSALLIEQTILPETLTSASGPQSIYTYEYKKGVAMDVCYKSFGDDPVNLLYVRQYNVPQAINGGAREAIIKIEVRILVICTSSLITFSYALF